MKILQVISGKFVNGAMVHVNLLARQLAERGHEVHLLCRPRSWIWRRLSRTPVIRHKSEMYRLPPNELMRVAQWAREEKFDVIHTHMSRAHFFGILLKRLTRIPCVATAHTSLFQLHWRFNDLVIANSDATRQYHARYNGVAKHKLITIPCFIDLEKFSSTSDEVRNRVRRELGIHDQRPLLGVIGAVIPRKGQRELFHALPEIVNQFPNVKLGLIGQYGRQENYTKQLRKILFQKQMFKRVIWIGRRNNVHELVQGLDACIVPSLKEPQGLCALEAMAAGVPVACSRVDGLKEFVRPEETGMLFDPRSPATIAESVARILNEHDLRDRMVRQAKQMVQDDFSPEAITTRIENALHSVTSKRSVRKAA